MVATLLTLGVASATRFFSWGGPPGIYIITRSITSSLSSSLSSSQSIKITCTSVFCTSVLCTSVLCTSVLCTSVLRTNSPAVATVHLFTECWDCYSPAYTSSTHQKTSAQYRYKTTHQYLRIAPIIDQDKLDKKREEIKNNS